MDKNGQKELLIGQFRIDDIISLCKDLDILKIITAEYTACMQKYQISNKTI